MKCTAKDLVLLFVSVLTTSCGLKHAPPLGEANASGAIQIQAMAGTPNVSVSSHSPDTATQASSSMASFRLSAVFNYSNGNIEFHWISPATATLDFVLRGLNASRGAAQSSAWVADYTSGVAYYTDFKSRFGGAPAPNTLYHFSLKASDGANEYGSDEIAFRSPPGQPSIVDLRYAGAMALSISWAAPANGAAGYGFKIQEVGKGYFVSNETAPGGSTSTVLHTGIFPNRTYNVTVFAVNDTLLAGPESAPATANTPFESPFSLTGNATSYTTIQLNWTPVTDLAVGYYQIRIAGQGNTPSPWDTTHGTSYTYSAAVANTGYDVEIWAYDAGGRPVATSNRMTLATVPFACTAIATLHRDPTASQSDGATANVGPLYAFPFMGSGLSFSGFAGACADAKSIAYNKVEAFLWNGDAASHPKHDPGDCGTLSSKYSSAVGADYYYDAVHLTGCVVSVSQGTYNWIPNLSLVY